ncbi:MAG TPA: SAP domain-containing protein [Dehalococcoidia bacterium]|nr:SAP domain-containing protein [Dehalococcoidia bacterium]
MPKVPHEPVKGEQAGMLGVPCKVHTQKRPYKVGQMEFESYAKYKTTMSDRFTIDCSYCGFLTSEKTFKEALETAGRLKLRHQSKGEKIAIFDRLAQRGACNTWDAEGHCIGYKEWKEKEAMDWKAVTELKQMCSQRGLPTDGRKEDLIRRLK